MSNVTSQRLNVCKSLKGFTLIELMIVMVIIGVLVAAGTYSWLGAQTKARDSRRKSDVKAIQQALESYYIVYGFYPASTSGIITCNTPFDSSQRPWAGSFSCNSAATTPKTYMQKLPTDPVPGSVSYYYSVNNPPANTKYTLSVFLENSKDPDLVGLICSPQSGRNFCATNP